MKRILSIIIICILISSTPISAKDSDDLFHFFNLPSFTESTIQFTEHVSPYDRIKYKAEAYETYAKKDGVYAVATAAENKSLKYDVHPYILESRAFFFLPCTADITNLTISTFDSEGNVVDSLRNVNYKKSNKQRIWLNGKAYSVAIMQSELPSLIFDINEDYGTIEAMNSCPTHDTKCYGDVVLEVTDALAEKKNWEGFTSVENDEKKHGTMEIKGRGNTTWTWDDPTSKKPYQFKLEKKTDVLGMGKNKTWILLKNDQFVVKNKLGLDLGKDLGVPYTSSSEFVDVFMNGEYLGLYLLCEKVEVGSTRVDISDLDEEYENNGESISGLDMTGGYLIEFDCWPDDLQVVHKASNYRVTIKSPEDLSKSIYNKEYAYITRYISNWLSAVYSKGKTSDGRSYLDYINRESFVNYFFHQEFLANYDCGISSTYMFKDKDSIDPLLYAGPIWDSDRAFEIMEHPTGWVLPKINHIFSTKPTLYNKLCTREDFVDLLVGHYENSDIPQILAQSYKKIDTYVEDIGVSANMNSIRWSLPALNLEWMKNFMIERAQWIDKNYYDLYNFVK